MSENIKQTFIPAITIHTGEKKVEIKNRNWIINCNATAIDSNQDMGYMGQHQIEEIWKHYYKNTYVSNYGCVSKIENEQENEMIDEKLLKDLMSDGGVRWHDLSKTIKKIIVNNVFIPFNRKGSGCQVCLNMTGNTSKYDIHRIIANKFLYKPKEAWGVHHIDNNSYNNSVTNLVWVTKEQHNQRIHPMSWK